MSTSRDRSAEDPAQAGRRLSFGQCVVGVLLGLLLGVGLIHWLAQRGEAAARSAAGDQGSVVTLQALAELVTGAEDVQAAVERFVDGRDDIAAVRVVDVSKRRLLASTETADYEGELPSRLERSNADHKIWYDLGVALRGAVEANLEEGRAWKEEIEIVELEEGVRRLSAPIEDEDGVTGVVLLDARPASAVAPRSPELGEGADAGPGREGGASASAWPWLTILGATLLFALVAWPLRARVDERWLARLAFAYTALVLVTASLFALGGLSAERLAVEEQVARLIESQRDEITAITGAYLGETAADWDVDRYREPRGVIAADGTVDAAEIESSFAHVRSRFRNAFFAFVLVGTLLAAWIALGWAVATGRALKRHQEAYTYVAPAIVGMLILVFFPFLYGILLSFTGQTLYNLNEPIYEIWTGFDNYVSILTDFELVREIEGEKSFRYDNFYYTLLFTIVWTVTNVTVGVSVGLLLALILNTKNLAFKPLYRVLLILPWAVPNYITALIWKGMFHQQFGVVNQVVQMFGGEPIAWFDTPVTAFVTILTTNGWLSFPFMMVVALGALQSIPSDLYEAARVDGATRWQQFTNITLPSLKPALVPAVILSVVWTFNMFNIPYLVSEGQPGGATEILITHAYKLAFEQYQYGYAAAYATVIFGILLIYGTWQNRVSKAYEGV